MVHFLQLKLKLHRLFSDQLGSTLLVTDSGLTPVTVLSYNDFGSIRYSSGTAAGPNSFTYSGQRQASPIGLDFYNARWYDTYLNRWTQPDSIIPDPFNPQDYDRYSYVNNNPVNYNDPTGHAYCPVKGAACINDNSDVNVGQLLYRLGQGANNGTPTTWGQLGQREQGALQEIGFNQTSYDNSDFVKSGAKDISGTDQDPVVWAIIMLSVARLSPKVIISLLSYFCMNGGDCGNELDISTHALERMFQRGVSIDQLQTTLQADPFQYFHDGIWKTGYYDPISRIFVVVANQVITTVIANVKPQYIENLKQVIP